MKCTVTSLSDADLARMLKQGDKLAACALATRHFEKARRFAMSIVKDPKAADDVAESTLLYVFKLIRSGQFAEKQNFQAFLFSAIKFRTADVVARAI